MADVWSMRSPDGSAPALAVRDRLAELEGEKAQLEAMGPPDDAPVAIHPMATKRYLDQIDALSSELKAHGVITADTPAAIFRELVEAVVVHPVAPRAPLDVEVRGRSAVLFDAPE